MKALITFQPNKNQDSFEGSRLRKTIKGALELNNVDYTSRVQDEYDIVHLITFEDINKVNDAISRGIPVVASSLMCEGDSHANYLDFDFDDGQVKYTLSNKAIKFLKKVNHIIVPCEHAKLFLQKSGINTPVSVIMPGVNFARFDFSRDDEKELFWRYFREDSNKKLVIANGEINYLEGAQAFVDAAAKCPECAFYFFLNCTDREMRGSGQLKALVKKSSKNVHFVSLVPDDIYRSALINASVFMAPCYRYTGVVSMLEAMAAKCELVIREQDVLPEMIKDGETAHVAKFSETLSLLVKDCVDGKIKSTITSAYQEAKKYTIESVGEQLKSLYEKLINK